MNAIEQVTDLEQTVKRLGDERKIRREIFDAIQSGIIVLSPSLSVQNINAEAKRLLSVDDDYTPLEDLLPLFKNKKTTLPFKLDHWLEFIKEYPSAEPTEIMIWARIPKTLKTLPLLFSAKALLGPNNTIKNILLVIYDRSVHAQADEQKRLMEAAFNSYNGQFIANEKGSIIKANDSFVAISGMTKPQLKKLTLMEWLETQVDLKNDTSGLLRTLLDHKFWSGEVELKPAGDTVFHAILSISMIDDGDYNIEHYIVNLQSITDIKEAHAKLEHMAFFDPLTGLPNRKQALDQISESIIEHRRQKTFSSLLCVNLDRFKGINDAFGRKTGDKFLIKISEALQKILRPKDTLARLEGDEFVIISSDTDYTTEKAADSAYRLALKVSHVLNHHFDVEELTLHSSVRIGVVTYPGYTEENAETLLINADLAVTHAKEVKSQNKVFTYDVSLTEEVKSRRQIENDLVESYNRGEIQLHFQAQVDRDGQPCGAEVLARWNHPQFGYISPGIFIEIAEESRHILKLGAWIMYRAFLQAKVWERIKPDFNLSINISPIQFHEADFINNVMVILQETKANPENITLEMTEGVLVSDIESAVQKITQLQKIGFKVSIDDFGTGYSSLTYFQKLPIHELKIDRSFIKNVPDNTEEVAIFESIVRLAQAKNLVVVAEGVETEEQAQFVHQQTENILIQGYLYSKPCSAEEFEKQFLVSNDSTE